MSRSWRSIPLLVVFGFMVAPPAPTHGQMCEIRVGSVHFQVDPGESATVDVPVTLVLRLDDAEFGRLSPAPDLRSQAFVQMVYHLYLADWRTERSRLGRMDPGSGRILESGTQVKWDTGGLDTVRDEPIFGGTISTGWTVPLTFAAGSRPGTEVLQFVVTLSTRPGLTPLTPAIRVPPECEEARGSVSIMVGGGEYWLTLESDVPTGSVSTSAVGMGSFSLTSGGGIEGTGTMRTVIAGECVGTRDVVDSFRIGGRAEGDSLLLTVVDFREIERKPGTDPPETMECLLKGLKETAALLAGGGAVLADALSQPCGLKVDPGAAAPRRSYGAPEYQSEWEQAEGADPDDAAPVRCGGFDFNVGRLFEGPRRPSPL